ncbi:MAG: hydantoinase/oxoprolinase family protein [Gammaproteobacteria bacterium]|mgnify:FL=1|jgi:N-methylhydantoinase A|nr:hydantoinase/oxoprolinase family protein [Gammaproteobacteria bacterium]|tara:strand:+ start:13992 stop:16043 length:2052 start_codon:yes stop_codon:yes gene_type:complete
MGTEDIYIGIDVGGTFTDLTVYAPSQNRLSLHKLASTPDAPERAIVEGVREILEKEELSAANVVRLAHGTTVGTNALIQRRCGKVALITSEGFRDLLEIGRQTRPRVYDMHTDHPSPIVERKLRFEVPQRRYSDGSECIPLDIDALSRIASTVVSEKVDCVVVCFLHSYAYPEDEYRAVKKLQDELPRHISVISSAFVYPEFREYERFLTAVLNGTLITVVGSYIDHLSTGLAELGITCEIKISQSSGGLMSAMMARQLPIRASLSGPAAGVLGASRRARAADRTNIITLDVGGTSADVSLLHEGQPVKVHDRTLAGFPIRMPALDVNAVGAGGGSVAWIDRGGLLKVGPQSAGAIPGPACYEQGGDQATVTDANVLLGRLNGQALLGGNMPIKKALSEVCIASLASQLGMDVEDTALGIVKVACATMVKAIRSISIERGHNPLDFALFVYGGAGPLHATEVARELEVGTVIVPPDPGILCADGALASDLRSDFVKTVLTPLEIGAEKLIEKARTELLDMACSWFEDEGVSENDQALLWVIELRYFGQNYEISLPLADAPTDQSTCSNLMNLFHRAHETNYGFSSENELIQIVNLKVTTIGRTVPPPLPIVTSKVSAQPFGERRVMYAKGDWCETPIYQRADLGLEQVIIGPAIIEQMDTTTIIFPGDQCAVDKWGNLAIQIN